MQGAKNIFGFVLIALFLHANWDDKCLIICCLKPHFQEKFTLIGLDQVIPIHINESEAFQRIVAA